MKQRDGCSPKTSDRLCRSIGCDPGCFGVTEHGRCLRDPLASAETFIAEEEEGFVLDHRAAERAAKFINIEFWIAQAIKGRRRIIEERRRVQRAVAEELKHVPVKLIPTGFADSVYNRTRITSVLGGVGVGQNAKFLEGIGAEPLNGVRHVDRQIIAVAPIEQKIVRLRSLSVDGKRSNLCANLCGNLSSSYDA